MNETGRGQAHAAITVLNATATGRGASIAIEGGVGATWEARDSPGFVWQTRDVDDRLARAVHQQLQSAGIAPAGATVSTSSTFPPARGLKTSSSAATALVRAAVQSRGHPMKDQDVMGLAVDAAIQAGVTLTGAFDDQAAVTLGGCHWTDNKERRILQSFDAPRVHVAVWVPKHGIAKTDVAQLDATPLAPLNEAAEARLREGDIAEALTLNGAAFHDFYSAAGLSVSAKPTEVAMDHGALGAGLSGTGPAVAALFDDRVDLPVVEGGHWHWTRTVPT